MRVILLGDTLFTKKCLDRLLEESFEIVGILQTDPLVAEDVSDYYSLSTFAQKHNINYKNYITINEPEVIDFVTPLKCDVVLAFGFNGIIKDPLLNIPKLGCVAGYAGLLPEYPGQNPISWAILRNLSTTGLTFYRMAALSYGGNIILREECEILPEDDASTLYEKICKLADIMIPQLKLELYLGLPKQKIQQFSQIKSFCGYIARKDRQLKFEKTCKELITTIRAFTAPLQGSWFEEKGGNKIMVWQAQEGRFKTQQPIGSLVYEDENFYVMTTHTNDLVITNFEKLTKLV